MTPHRQRFEDSLARFGECYQSVEVRVICARKDDQWRNIWTRIEFSPKLPTEIALEKSLPHTDAIRAEHCALPSDRAREIMDSIESGKLTLGETEVVYLSEKHKPEELGIRFDYYGPPDEDYAFQAGAAEWRSARLGANGPDRLNQYLDVDGSDLDRHLRVQRIPYRGLTDLLRAFALRHISRNETNQRTGVAVIAPLMFRFGKCSFSERKLRVSVECHPAFTKHPALVGVVQEPPDGEVERTSIEIGEPDWQEKDGMAKFGRDIEVAEGASVTLILSLDGVDVDERRLQEASLDTSNHRLAAHDSFDPGLKVLGTCLRGESKQTDVETGVAWLLNLCGLACVRLGDAGLRREIDVLAFCDDPRVIVAVECTTARSAGKADEKLGDLILRAGRLSEAITGTTVLPVLLIANKDCTVSKSSQEQAEESGVAIVDAEDIEELLGKARQGMGPAEVLGFLRERIPASRSLPYGSGYPGLLGRGW